MAVEASFVHSWDVAGEILSAEPGISRSVR